MFDKYELGVIGKDDAEEWEILEKLLDVKGTELTLKGSECSYELVKVLIMRNDDWVLLETEGVVVVIILDEVGSVVEGIFLVEEVNEGNEVGFIGLKPSGNEEPEIGVLKL